MKLTIIGASGHGRVVADIAKLNGYDEISFLDDNEKISCCGTYPVVGKSYKAKNISHAIFVAIGNPNHRQKIMNQLSDKQFPVLIHPSAFVAADVTIGKGTVVVAGAVINPGSIIGNGCIINTTSSVGHDCYIGDYVHVAPGSHICGTSIIGCKTWIGAGAVVSNNISICDDCIIGIGAAVISNIKITGTYVGVPARLMKKLSNDISPLLKGVSSPFHFVFWGAA